MSIGRPAESLAQLTERATWILSREIGLADTLRFLSQFATQGGNYTEERSVCSRAFRSTTSLQR
jgi:hypothetical protein